MTKRPVGIAVSQGAGTVVAPKSLAGSGILAFLHLQARSSPSWCVLLQAAHSFDFGLQPIYRNINAFGPFFVRGPRPAAHSATQSARCTAGSPAWDPSPAINFLRPAPLKDFLHATSRIR